MREQATVFGEVADEYDDVRAGYAPELAAAVFDYLGQVPRRAIEVGAGTGKATSAFAGRGAPIVCLEPDPQMADVLRTADRPGVEVVVSRFEDYSPPAGVVDLVFCAQAWHWVDAQLRCQLAYDALAPGGVLALFGHEYQFADPQMAAAVHGEAYPRYAPELLDDPTDTPPGGPAEQWFAVELAGCGLFADVHAFEFRRVVRYPTVQYLALLRTFSNHRMLAPDRRAALHEGIAAVVDARGGVVNIDLATVLAIGRRRD
jgi:SAM-dependent methyltransferase